jgi:hypothetical protein
MLYGIVDEVTGRYRFSSWAGLRINDGMGKFIVQRTIKEMIHAGHSEWGNWVTFGAFSDRSFWGDTGASAWLRLVSVTGDMRLVREDRNRFAVP